MLKLATHTRIVSLGALLVLAGCGGGTAAPASSAPPASAAAKASVAASAPASAKPAESAAAKPAASGAASGAAKPAASGSAAAKPVALPSSCPSPSPAASGGAAAGASGAAAASAKPAGSAAASPSAAAKPSFTPQTDVVGEAAPGPYTENQRITATAGQPVKIINANSPQNTPIFLANTIVVKAGDQITLNVTNCSTAFHNIQSPALKMNKTDIPVGEDVTIRFTAPTQPGKYMFWCSAGPANGPTHAERGDTGEIIVQ